jgi:hypothetical protein
MDLEFNVLLFLFLIALEQLLKLISRDFLTTNRIEINVGVLNYSISRIENFIITVKFKDC